MRKAITLITAALLSMSATAADQQLLPNVQKQVKFTNLESQIHRFDTPDGPKTFAELPKSSKAQTAAGTTNAYPADPSIYALEGFFYTYYDVEWYAGIASKALVQDDAVYLDGSIFMGTFDEPVAIRADRDGANVSIPTQKIYDQYDMYGMGLDLYIGTLVANADGTYGISDQPYTMYIDDEGAIRTAGDDLYTFENLDGKERQILGLFADFSAMGESDRELLTYTANFSVKPVNVGERTELPADAEPVEYLYSYNQGGQTQIVRKQVYIDGNDVYLNGMTGNLNLWVKGTITDGKLIVPSHQFLTTETMSYLLEFNAAESFTYDEFGFMNGCEVADAAIFDVTDNGFVLTSGIPTVCYMPNGVAWYMYDLEITLFTGAAACKPKAPAINYIADWLQYYNQYYLSAYTPTQGVNGEYLAPENLEVAVWADDEIFVFSADDGYNVSEDMDWIPVGYKDNKNGDDISVSSSSMALWIYDGLYEELGLQCRNIVDGITYYSDINYISITPDEDGTYYRHTVEVENDDPTAIKSVEQTRTSSLFDLQGRRLTQAKGLVINAGQISFVK